MLMFLRMVAVLLLVVAVVAVVESAAGGRGCGALCCASHAVLICSTHKQKARDKTVNLKTTTATTEFSISNC